MEQYRKSPRAKFLDYNSGDYFITICTKEKKHYFGEISASKMELSAVGRYLETQLGKCSEFYRNISIPLFVIMPNHVHIIVPISNNIDDKNGFEQRSPNKSLRANPECQRHVTVLSKYISSLKGATTKFAKSQGFEFGWQMRYHDHIIRGKKDANNISEYIQNNVAK